MFVFAILLTVTFILDMLGSFYLFIQVASANVRKDSLTGFTIGMLLANGCKVGLLVWVWLLQQGVLL